MIKLQTICKTSPVNKCHFSYYNLKLEDDILKITTSYVEFLYGTEHTLGHSYIILRFMDPPTCFFYHGPYYIIISEPKLTPFSKSLPSTNDKEILATFY